MKSYTEVKSYIKFLISDLSSQNGHHTFEHICRHFTRQRIGINVLPATGPVSSGGDQGRDFETFKTFLNYNEDTSLSIGNIGSKSFAFGCTIQKNRLSSKIKSDIKKMVEQGTPIDGVYYFISHDLSSSERHDLQKWANETYSVSLEIFDGEGLSEQLSSKDLFWIAEEFLHIPSEIFPPVDDIEYEKLKEKWKKEDPSFQNYAEFEEIKTAARRTLFDENTKQDLLFWIDKLEKYFKLDGNPVLKRRAAYEAIAVHIRGTRKLEGKETLVSEYFSLGDFNNPIEMQDALVVWTYADTSTKLNTSLFKKEDLKKWRESIELYTEENLKENNPVAINAYLYETKAQLLLIGPDGNHDLDGAFDWWLKLTDLIEKTPLFPLERLSNILTIMLPFIGSHPKYEELTSKVDSLLIKRIGGFNAAENCRNRGLEFYKQGYIIKAINELHKAKIDWFAEETLYGSLLSMLLIAEWYLELGLTYAAKNYGLAVAFMAARASDERIKTFLPRGLLVIAKCEYLQGDWVNFLERSEFVFKSMGVYSPSMDNKTSEQIFNENIFYVANVIGISNVLSKELHEFANNRVLSFGMEDWFSEIIPISIETWAKTSPDDLAIKLSENLYGKPFSDIDKIRKVEWKQLGIKWKIEWENNFLETSKAEQFIAILQILLADLSQQDLYLLPAKATVLLKFESVEKFHIEQLHTNSEYKWQIILSNKIPKGSEEINDYNMEIFGILGSIISEISVLPNDKFMGKIEEAMKKGVLNKTFMINSYEVMYREAVSKEGFEEAIKLTPLVLDEKFVFTEPVHKELKWKSDIIPEYNIEKSKKDIANRYKNSLIPISKTIKRLKESADFQLILKQLRAKGWKDWHIIMAIGSTTVNFRINSYEKPKDLKMIGKEMKDNFNLELSKPEDDTSIYVPTENYSIKELELNLFFSMISTLKMLGLDIKNGTPNKEGLEIFLKHRYNYWSDDIEHENYFN